VISVDIPHVWNHHEWIQAFEKFLDVIDVHHVRTFICIWHMAYTAPPACYILLFVTCNFSTGTFALESSAFLFHVA
jgi:hypothetical protein